MKVETIYIYSSEFGMLKDTITTDTAIMGRK